jgi:hypothetical protein
MFSKKHPKNFQGALGFPAENHQSSNNLVALILAHKKSET